MKSKKYSTKFLIALPFIGFFSVMKLHGLTPVVSSLARFVVEKGERFHPCAYTQGPPARKIVISFLFLLTGILLDSYIGFPILKNLSVIDPKDPYASLGAITGTISVYTFVIFTIFSVVTAASKE